MHSVLLTLGLRPPFCAIGYSGRAERWFRVSGLQSKISMHSRPARQLQYFGFALTPLLRIGDGAVTWALKLPGRMVGAAVSLFSPSPASGWPDLATSPSPAPRTPLHLGFRACAETLNLKLLSFLCPGCPTSFSALATSRYNALIDMHLPKWHRLFGFAGMQHVACEPPST